MDNWRSIPPPRDRLGLYPCVIERMGVSSARELAEELEWSTAIVYRDMPDLVADGTVMRIESWPIVWELAPVVGSTP